MTSRAWLWLGVLACLGVACAGPSTPAVTIPPTTTTNWHVPSGHVSQVVLTPEHDDHYAVARDGVGSLLVSAPSTNVGGDLRMLMWQADRPATVNQQACATWLSVIDLSERGLSGIAGNPHLWQPGLALRIVTDGTVTKALSIAQNVWAGAMWVFWVQMWDTAKVPKMQASIEFDARHLLTTSAPGAPVRFAAPPWHVCARVVGDRLDFKLWTGQSAEPSYADPEHAFHARLPADWVYAGYTGTYAGHLKPGTTVRFSGITTAPARS